MNLIKYSLMFLYSVTAAEQCSICLDTLSAPMNLICNHTYCNTCITDWLTISSVCPGCRCMIALSPNEIQQMELCGFEFPHEILGPMNPILNKSFIRGRNWLVNGGNVIAHNAGNVIAPNAAALVNALPNDVRLYALSALLTFVNSVVQEVNTGISNYEVFPKEYLFPILLLVNNYRLNEMALERFITNFNRSLGLMSDSDIRVYILNRTADIRGLLIPVFGHVERAIGVDNVTEDNVTERHVDEGGHTASTHISTASATSHSTAFKYSGRSAVYVMLGLVNVDEIEKLIIEDCVVNESTLISLNRLVNGNRIKEVKLINVRFDALITVREDTVLRSVRLERIFGSEESIVKANIRQLIGSGLTNFSIFDDTDTPFIDDCLRLIGELECKLEVLKVEGHRSKNKEIFDSIFRGCKDSLKEMSFIGCYYSECPCILDGLREIELRELNIVSCEMGRMSKISFPKSLEVLTAIELVISSGDEEGDEDDAGISMRTRENNVSHHEEGDDEDDGAGLGMATHQGLYAAGISTHDHTDTTDASKNFIRSLKKLTNLRILSLDLGEFEDITDLPESLKNMKLERFCLTASMPSNLEELSSIVGGISNVYLNRRVDHARTSTSTFVDHTRTPTSTFSSEEASIANPMELKVTLEMNHEYSRVRPKLIKETLRSLQAYRLTSLTIGCGCRLTADDLRVMFEEVSCMELDNFGFYVLWNKLGFYESFRRNLSPESRIGSLTNLTWIHESFLSEAGNKLSFLSGEMGHKLASMMNLREINLSIVSDEDDSYLEFFKALSAGNVTRVNITNTVNSQWNEEFYSILRGFKSLEIIDLSPCSEATVSEIRAKVNSRIGHIRMKFV